MRKPRKPAAVRSGGRFRGAGAVAAGGGFAEMLTGRHRERLDAWMVGVQADDLPRPELAGLAPIGAMQDADLVPVRAARRRQKRGRGSCSREDVPRRK